MLIRCAVTYRAADLHTCFCICKKQVNNQEMAWVSFPFASNLNNGHMTEHMLLKCLPEVLKLASLSLSLYL